jgi:peptidoglycan/LPS O-acetylase OafA/YrhL
MVCVCHLAQTLGSPLHNFSSFGNFGVRVFFVISGMLITRLLLEEREREGSISLKSFYFRRTLRIFPAMWFYMGVMLLFQAAGVISLQPSDAFHAFTYTVNYDQSRSWYIGHLWSLSVEEQFYLLWPMALYFGSPRLAAGIAGAAVALAPALRFAILVWRPGAPVGEWFPTTCDALATGCLLALLPLEGRKASGAWMMRGWFAAIPFLAVFLNSLQYHVDHRYTFFFSTLGQTIMNCAIALTIQRLVTWPGDFAGRILNARPLVWIGTISYSLYLWQQPFLNHDTASWITRFPLNLAAALFAAGVSYYFVETPILNLRKRRAFFVRPARDASIGMLAKSAGTRTTEV